MNIFTITEDDLPQLAKLQVHLMHAEGNIERMRKLLPHMLNDNNYFLLGAKAGERLVGFLTGIICYDIFGQCDPFMVVDNVIVDREFRHRGVGQALMEEIEKKARVRHCRYMRIVSAAYREKAARLYHKLGFESHRYRGFRKAL